MKKILAMCLLLNILLLSSCTNEMSALEITQNVSEHFDFNYGAVYSDEYGELNEFCFSDDLKEKIFGANASKYEYIKAVSGYFSRDMQSGSEFIAIEIYDRSQRAELMAVLYRRAALKLDMDARVWSEGNFVFFICDNAAEDIIEYIKEQI